MAYGLSCSAACGTFPGQGSNLCPLHCQAEILNHCATREAQLLAIIIHCFFQSRGQDLIWFLRGGGSHLGAPWTPERVEATAFCFCSLSSQCFKKKFKMVLLLSRGLSSLGMGYISSVSTAFLTLCSLTITQTLGV